MANILVACEFSGRVRDEFLALGHNAWSCDLLPTESPIPDRHIQLNVLDLINRTKSGYWDLLIAHPPCTYLANSSNKHLYIGKRFENGPDEERFRLMRNGAAFFNAVRTCGIKRICLENPIQHKYARALIPKYQQIVHPHWFGHAETKATCLWLDNLPPLVPTNLIQPDYVTYPPGKGNGFKPVVHSEGPDPKGQEGRRMKNRSRTKIGLAKAMAAQWSPLL